MSRNRRFAGILAVAATCSLGPGIGGAFAAVTPGWECIPATAGAAVVSGGTAAAPSCAASATKVLAPTYVSTGVGGKPTVQFSTVNVQVVSGSGSTAGTANGEGNLIVGYAEHPSNLARTGSNDLIVGTDDGWTGHGDIVGGWSNQVGASYAAAFGKSNTALGTASLVAGQGNRAAGTESSVTGGQYNITTDPWASVSGGCDNLAGAGNVPKGPCGGVDESILGGSNNHADGAVATVSGGQANYAHGGISTVSGGLDNASDGTGSSVSGGYSNTSGNNETSILGGAENTATGEVSSIAGGYYNTTTVDESAILGGCSNLAGSGNLSIQPKCSQFGDSFMSIVGGIGNQDTTLGSSILGGYSNSITGGQDDAIAGGSGESVSNPTNYLSRVGSTGFTP